MYAIYGNIYHQYTPNVSIYTIHGSYGCIYIAKEMLSQKNTEWDPNDTKICSIKQVSNK